MPERFSKLFCGFSALNSTDPGVGSKVFFPVDGSAVPARIDRAPGLFGMDSLGR
jgi:hypothetical protein